MNRKGFTVVELLLAISIISFLTSIITVAFGTARARANDVATLNDAKSLGLAAQSYRSDNGTYPPMPDPAGQIVTSNETTSDDHRWTDLWSQSGVYTNNPPVSRDPDHPYAYALYEDPNSNQQLGVIFSYQESPSTTDTNRCYPFGLPPDDSQSLGNVTQKIADSIGSAVTSVVKPLVAHADDPLTVSCQGDPANPGPNDTVEWTATYSGGTLAPGHHYYVSWRGDDGNGDYASYGPETQDPYDGYEGPYYMRVEVDDDVGQASAGCMVNWSSTPTSCPDGQTLIDGACWVLDLGNAGLNTPSDTTDWPCTGNEYCTCLQ